MNTHVIINTKTKIEHVCATYSVALIYDCGPEISYEKA